MSWKDDLLFYDQQEVEDLDDMEQKENMFHSEDIGFLNRYNGAGMIIRKNKRIECLSDFGLGFVFDPNHQSLSVFAPNLKLFTSKIEKHEYNKAESFLKNEYQEILDMWKGEEE